MGGPIEHPKGTAILILGILSLICFAPLGIAAWLMGNTAIREIDGAPGRYSNRQTVQIGRILGIVGTVILILGVLVWLLFFVLLGVSASTN
jgi:hypothetical protein